MAEDRLQADVVDEAERLTRLARRAVDERETRAYREKRADLLAAHDYRAHVREEDDRAVLVCHPAEWLEDGVVRTGRIEDTDRAVEVPLSGAGDPEDWDAVEAHNQEIVAAVRDRHGEVHAANARAFADFMGNHYARPLESATREEVAEFLAEYYPRNAWATEEQRAVVETSLELCFEAVGETPPTR